jgi:hypothetical protein
MFDLYTNGFWTILNHHWVWLLFAFAIGIFIGWRTCEQVPDNNG